MTPKIIKDHLNNYSAKQFLYDHLPPISKIVRSAGAVEYTDFFSAER